MTPMTRELHNASCGDLC